MRLQYDNCPNCFSALNQMEVCPQCGFRIEQLYLNPNVLPPFVFLNKQYLLGRVLGQGGFGVTYIAQDIRNNRICAIKEYMPVEYAKRGDDGNTVVVSEAGSRQVYEHGRKRFLEEAQTLYRLKENPIVVRIIDFFEENNTGYLVMEYLDGINLKGEMNRRGGRIEQQEAKVILATIASSLIEIHRQGILHRDISPENIFLTRQREIRLIDFGSARNYVSNQKKNGLSVLLKPGFAPPEQYDSHGEQGPWTDVYSLAATFYYAVSGQKLPDSLYRQRGSTYTRLVDMGLQVSAQTSRAIDKALELEVGRRYPDFVRFLNDIDMDYKSETVQQKEEEKRPDVSATDKTTKPEYVPKPRPRNDIPMKKKKWFSFFRKTIQVPVVLVVDGMKKGLSGEIPDREIFKIGRSAQRCHMVLDYDGSISNIHCLVRYNHREKMFMVQDQSSNGTFLEDGTRLERDRSYFLEDGSRIYLTTPDNMLELRIEDR